MRALREAYKKNKGFYRNNYRHTLAFLNGLLMLVFALLLVFILVLWSELEPPFYATSSVGQITELVSWDGPPSSAS